jgi:4-amino-4-deoxy-L-arabinose transferase-like glycosyltransferase
LLLAPVFLLQLVTFLAIARHRLIDGDEGFYLMASRLLFEHKVPYRDFFFTQMPLSPYVYALWVRVAGCSWVSARVLCALLASLAGTVLFVQVCAETKRSAAGLTAILLFASSALVFAWFSIAKTFALSAVFLLFAHFILTRRTASNLNRSVAIAGLLLGVAVDVRLYLLALAPLFLWWICRDAEARLRFRTALSFLAGLTLALLSNIYFLAVAPREYLFGNLLFHAIRSNGRLVGNIGQKFFTVRRNCC